MSKNQSKVVSFRLPLKEYAQLLIECSDCESDLSGLAKEKFRLSTLVPGLKKNLSENQEELKKTQLKLDDEVTKTKKLSEEKTNLESQLLELKNTSKKELEELQKTTAIRIEKEETKQSEFARKLKESQTEGKKTLDIAKKQREKIKVLESKIISLEATKNEYASRLNEANDYLVSEGIGLGFLGSGEVPQF